jgi:hypothetical protein
MTELTSGTIVNTDIDAVPTEGDSKTRLCAVNSQLRALEQMGIHSFAEVTSLSYLYYASSKGGKAYPYQTYLEMAERSENEYDRKLGQEYLCSMIVVQLARRNLIAVGDLVLQRHGVESGVALYGEEQTTQDRLRHVLEYRKHAEAKTAYSRMGHESGPLRALFQSYARHTTVKFLFDDLGFPIDDKEVQYYDRSLRFVLGGRERALGFPRLADRVMAAWILKNNPPEITTKLMQSSEQVLNLKLDSYDSDYYRSRKFDMFMRHLVAEDAYRQYHLFDVKKPEYFPVHKPITNFSAQTIDKYVDVPRFFGQHADFALLPLSLRLLLRAIAEGSELDTHFLHAFPKGSYGEGLRILKGIIFSGAMTDARKHLQFSSTQYYADFMDRVAQMAIPT